MNKIYTRFENETIRLTFRLLPSVGSMPWAVSAPMVTENGNGFLKHDNPILQKVTKKKPWFGSVKEDNENALKKVVEFIEKEDDDDANMLKQLVEEPEEKDDAKALDDELSELGDEADEED
jgi:hypothetical protein